MCFSMLREITIPLVTIDHNVFTREGHKKYEKKELPIMNSVATN